MIEAVKGPLNDNGIVFLQGVDFHGTCPCVTTVLLHESGEFLSTETPIFCKDPNNPQALGSGITYSKRYSLQAIMGLPTEDDDGNAGARTPAAPKTIANKPEVDVGQLKSMDGAAYLAGFASEQAAIAAISKSKTIQPAAMKVIEEFFKSAEDAAAQANDTGAA